MGPTLGKRQNLLFPGTLSIRRLYLHLHLQCVSLVDGVRLQSSWCTHRQGQMCLCRIEVDLVLLFLVSQRCWRWVGTDLTCRPASWPKDGGLERMLCVSHDDNHAEREFAYGEDEARRSFLVWVSISRTFFLRSLLQFLLFSQSHLGSPHT